MTAEEGLIECPWIGYLDEEVAEAAIRIEHLHIFVLPLEGKLLLPRAPRNILVALLRKEREFLIDNPLVSL